jgi:hypothetical protein
MRRGGGVIVLAALVAVAACVGPTEPSSAPSLAIPSKTLSSPLVTPAASLPTVSPPSSASPAPTLDCSGYDPADMLGKDPILEAMFPARADGGTLKGVTSYTVIAVLCNEMLVTPSMVPQGLAAFPPGWDVAWFSMAFAEYDFTDPASSVAISALRSTGNEGSAMLDHALANWNSEDYVDPYVEHVGGKPVRVVQDTYDNWTYLYATGEVLFELSGTNHYADPDTTAVLHALP